MVGEALLGAGVDGGGGVRVPVAPGGADGGAEPGVPVERERERRRTGPGAAGGGEQAHPGERRRRARLVELPQHGRREVDDQITHPVGQREAAPGVRSGIRLAHVVPSARPPPAGLARL